MIFYNHIMSETPDDEHRARDNLFAEMGGFEVKEDPLHPSVQSSLEHIQFQVNRTQSDAEVLPGISANFLNQYGFVTSHNEVNSKNSALLCALIHGQKGGTDKEIASNRDLFCEFVLYNTKICDFWIALRDSDEQPQTRFIFEELREDFFKQRMQLDGGKEDEQVLQLLDQWRCDISKHGLPVAEYIFDTGNVNAETINCLKACILFFSNCLKTGKTDQIKPGGPSANREDRLGKQIDKKILELSMQKTDPNTKEAKQLLQRWQELRRQDFITRHKYILKQTTPEGLTVIALGRGHFGSISGNSSTPGRYIESDFREIQNCAIDFHGASNLSRLIEKIGKSLNPFTTTPEGLIRIIRGLRDERQK